MLSTFTLDAGALSSALGKEVVECLGAPVGAGQLADSFRVTLTYAGGAHASVFVKLPTRDPDSAATATRIGAYARERRFYETLLPQLDLRTPRLLGVIEVGSAEPGLVLEDLSERTRPLDQLTDGNVEQITSAVRQLVGLQAPLWDDVSVGMQPWFYNRLTDQIEGLHERYAISWDRHGASVAEALTPEQVQMVEAFGPRCREWAAQIEGPRTLVHQDLRLDNLLWGDEGAWLVDWQTLSWGPPAWDLAFLLGSALEPSARRAVERGLVDEHRVALLSHSIRWDSAWDDYRRLSGAVLLGMVPAMAFVEPTPRGFEMFRSLIARGAQQAIDLHLTDFL